MNQDDRMWSSRDLFKYKDYEFDSHAELLISVSTSTVNGSNFVPPSLSIRLIDNNRTIRNIQLSFSEVVQLLSDFKIPLSNIIQSFEIGTEIILHKKTNKDTWLKFKFFKTPHGELVTIGIIFNDTDKASIVVTKGMFISIINIIKIFRDKYWNIYTDLQNDFKFSEMSNNIKGLNVQIQTLPSMFEIPSSFSQHSTVSAVPDEPEPTADTMQTINDYEQFVSETSPDIPEISIAEEQLEKKEKVILREFNSPLIDQTLVCNIANFENMMNTITVGQEWGTDLFVNSIKIPMGYSDNFSYLPCLTDEDRKSFNFLCRVKYLHSLRDYIDNKQPVPTSFNLLKYKATDISSENIELAFDLLMITSYIQCMRSNLETRVSEAQNGNKALLYAATRCYIDPLIFSFIGDQKPDVIKSCVIDRFKYYSEKGFFDKFIEHIEHHQVRQIDISDISAFLDKITRALAEFPDVQLVHDNLYKNKKLALPYKNKYSIEQIINEIIPLQVTILLGGEINPKDEDLIKLFTNKTETPTEGVKVKQQKAPPKYTSPIHRFVCDVDYTKQIPDSIKEEFIENIKSLNDNYNFSSFQLEELGDDIVKALYVWNEQENKKIAYSQFRANLEECIMKKEDIVAKVKGLEQVTDTIGAFGDGWV